MCLSLKGAGLESLELSEHSVDGRKVAYVTLDDVAEAQSRAYTRLQSLTMTISDAALPVQPSSSSSNQDIPNAAVTAGADVEAFKMRFYQLGRLYRQTVLTKLFCLDLCAVSVDKYGFLLSLAAAPARRNSFPGILNGSVSATTTEAKSMMAWPEARRTAKHWPKFEGAEFFDANEQLNRVVPVVADSEAE